MGFPVGLYIDGSLTETNAQNGDLIFKSNIISGCTNSLSVASGSTFDINGWFNATGQNNQILSFDDIKLTTNAWNLSAPNFLPQSSSPLLSGANFSYPFVINNTFFEQVSFRGAFGTTDWTAGWTNFDPQHTTY
jgi:hypothetical protein